MVLIYMAQGNGNPLQCSCLENPRDGGAWWAAVYGVTQNWTCLKQLSSSSSSNDWWCWTAFHKLICHPYILISAVSGQILSLLKNLAKIWLLLLSLFVRYMFTNISSQALLHFYFVTVPFEEQIKFFWWHLIYWYFSLIICDFLHIL